MQQIRTGSVSKGTRIGNAETDAVSCSWVAPNSDDFGYLIP